MSPASLLGSHLTLLPALAFLTSPLPTQRLFLFSKTGKLPSPPQDRTMFPSLYSFLHHCYAHRHLPPTGRKLTGTPSKNRLLPSKFPPPPLCPPITHSHPGSTDTSLSYSLFSSTA